MAAATFKRVVLGLHRSVSEETAIGAAADFAGLLRLDLLGLFAEDPNLLALAGLPFGRELRTREGGWRPIDAEQLARAMEAAARRARRAFVEKASSMQLTADFRSVKGSIAELVESLLSAGDIVAVPLPISAAERATAQFSRLFEAASRSAAAVLLLPSEIARQTGAIVAVAATPADTGVQIGRIIAAAAKEEFVLVDAIAGARMRPESLSAPLLSGMSERLVVLTRGAIDEARVQAIASARRVPVLVVEPEN